MTEDHSFTLSRTVKQRKNAQQYLPIIAVSQEENTVLVESTGSIHTLGDLPGILVGHPGAMIVTTNAARLLHTLDMALGDHPLWQWRISPDRREVRRVNGMAGARVAGTVVHFFGWKSPNKRGKGHYHYPLDPVVFCHRSIGELRTEGGLRVARLLEWGQDVRDWCQGHRLKVSPTGGGLAGQLLKDPRWFPEARRKVPRATNDRARVQLPGNYYRLLGDTFTPYQASYLDMKSAHHNIAATLPFPDPDSLMARGRFRVTHDTGVTVPEDASWVRAGSHAYNRVMAMHGLLYCCVTTPHLPPGSFPPPYMEHQGQRMAWVFTNELPLIRALGGRVEYVSAGWLAPTTAPALNSYARWSMAELDRAPQERKRWLKSSLLATYGILAARPQVMEFAFRQAEHGEPRRYPAGAGMLEGIALVGRGEREMPTANVIYRGMIEAQQRLESLTMARTLYLSGHNVLAVYADSVFIEAGRGLPLLSHPWQVEQELTELEFISATNFTSRELTRLPGIPRDSLTRFRLAEEKKRRMELWRQSMAKMESWTQEPQPF